MKNFEALWLELEDKISSKDPNSNSVKLVEAGIHAIGKKVIEEAGEVWIASEYQSPNDLALEISQLLYHVQVLAIAKGLKLEDIYKEL